MAANSEAQQILEEAVAGIPRMAEAIAALPAKDWSRALDAVEQRYLQTARVLGCAELPAQNWTSAMMVRLRAEVEERGLVKQKLKALLNELSAAAGFAGRSAGQDNRQ